MGMMEACCSQVHHFLEGCSPPLSLLQQETHFTCSGCGSERVFHSEPAFIWKIFGRFYRIDETVAVEGKWITQASYTDQSRRSRFNIQCNLGWSSIQITMCYRFFQPANIKSNLSPWKEFCEESFIIPSISEFHRKQYIQIFHVCMHDYEPDK